MAKASLKIKLKIPKTVNIFERSFISLFLACINRQKLHFIDVKNISMLLNPKLKKILNVGLTYATRVRIRDKKNCGSETLSKIAF